MKIFTEEEIMDQFDEKTKPFLEATKQKMSQQQYDEMDEDEMAERAFDAVSKAMMSKFRPIKAGLQAAANIALDQFCKKNKVDKDTIVELINDRIQDEDRDDLTIVDLYFLGNLL